MENLTYSYKARDLTIFSRSKEKAKPSDNNIQPCTMLRSELSKYIEWLNLFVMNGAYYN